MSDKVSPENDEEKIKEAESEKMKTFPSWTIIFISTIFAFIVLYIMACIFANWWAEDQAEYINEL